MDFIDWFSGIGGFRFGMEQAGHKCIGWVEWDKFARNSYEAIHNAEGEWTASDVSTVDYRTIPEAGCWCFGFPCQDISGQNANRKGFKGNRSSLFFAITKKLRQLKEWDPGRMPEYLFIENVEDFLSVNDGWDFLLAQAELDEIGYDAEWQVLKASAFGLPQSRPRVFIIGHLRGRSTRKVFPIDRTAGNSIKIVGRLQINKWRDIMKRVYDPSGIAPTILGSGGGYTRPKVLVNGQIRELTPKEYFRLNGFPDWAYEKAAAVNSATQLYKQGGNSVPIPVIYEIAKRMGENV